MTDAFLVPAASNRRVRWANGLGWTREIVRVPDTDDWDWRMSVAESDVPAAFSELPGVERELILLRGAGLDLFFADGETYSLRERYQSLRFAGERRLSGAPVDGRTEQLNLMWRRDRISRSQRQIVTGDGILDHTRPVDTEFIYLLEGEMTYRHGSSSYHLRPGDGLRLTGGSGDDSMEVAAGAIRLLVVAILRAAGPVGFEPASRNELSP